MTSTTRRRFFRPTVQRGIAVIFIALIAVTISGAPQALSRTGNFDVPQAVLLLLIYWVLAATLAGAVNLWRTNRKLLYRRAVTTAAVALALEVGLRLFHRERGLIHYTFYLSDSLHHVTKANARLALQADSPTGFFVAETNADALRTSYTRESFAAHRTRIAVLGDSFVFGVAAGQNDTVPAALEQDLRARFPRADVAVLNAGIPSYSPLLEALQLQRLVRFYHPNLVLLLLDATDFGDDARYASLERPGPDGPHFPPSESPVLLPTGPHWSEHVELLRRLPFLLPLPTMLMHPWRVVTDREGTVIRIQGVPQNRYFIYRYPPSVTEPYFERTLQNVNHAAEIARTIGAGFVFVVAPRYHHWNTAECPDDPERESYADRPYQFEYLRFFDRAASRVPYPILDLLPAFQATHEFPLVMRNDSHWSARGNRFVAGVLANYVAEHHLVGETPDASPR